MVQAFSELYRVNQSMAVSVRFVMSGKVLAGKQKTCNLSAVLLEPDVCQITAHAHKECASEYVRGFQAVCSQ